MDGRAKDHGRGRRYRDFVYVAEFELERAVLVCLQSCGGMNHGFWDQEWGRCCEIVEGLLARRCPGHQEEIDGDGDNGGG
jgi:hypothetical protein